MARLEVKGYRQRQGVDYDKIFSLIVMIKLIRILLVMAHYDYEGWQIDMKMSSQIETLRKRCI